MECAIRKVKLVQVPGRCVVEKFCHCSVHENNLRVDDGVLVSGAFEVGSYIKNNIWYHLVAFGEILHSKHGPLEKAATKLGSGRLDASTFVFPLRIMD